MNPYEAILNGSSASRSVQKKASAARPSSASAATSSQSGVLSRATKRRSIPKPRIRLSVLYRYQFDLPSPTMDNMMFTGRLQPDSFAKPISISLERLSLPAILPADPCYGLSANLLDTSQYRSSTKLTLDDEALLLSIESERPTSYLTDPSRRSAQKIAGGMPPARRTPQAPAPWMRRMGYDEYFGRSSSNIRPLSRNINANGPTALSSLKPQMPKSSSMLKPRKTLERSFVLSNKIPKHPTKRLAHLKPVKVTPLFPNFQEFDHEFISIEFDRAAKLTHDNRKSDAILFKKSKKAITTISLAGESDKKYLACYTPSDETLNQLENESGYDDEVGEQNKTLIYEWVHEYGIREASKYGLTGLRKGGISKRPRTVYAMHSFTSEDGNKRIGFMTRVGVSWKLSQRLGILPKLGKPHLKIESINISKEDEDRDVQKASAAIKK